MTKNAIWWMLQGWAKCDPHFLRGFYVFFAFFCLFGGTLTFRIFYAISSKYGGHETTRLACGRIHRPTKTWHPGCSKWSEMWAGPKKNDPFFTITLKFVQKNVFSWGQKKTSFAYFFYSREFIFAHFEHILLIHALLGSECSPPPEVSGVVFELVEGGW